MKTKGHVRNSSGHILPIRMARALSQIAEGVSKPWSESDDYFLPFYAKLDATIPITAESLRGVLKVGSRYSLDVFPLDFASSGADWGDDEVEAAFLDLDAVMRATLSDLTLVYARAEGVLRVRTWAFGRMKKCADDQTWLEGLNWLVGLRTTTTET